MTARRMRCLLPALFATLPCAALAADVAGMKEAASWVTQYTAILNARDAGRLAELLDDRVPVVIRLMQGTEPPLRFTLTRDEFLQQQRALWRFAPESRYTATKPVSGARYDDDTQELRFTLEEQHSLFGARTQQRSDIRMRLKHTDGVNRITAIDADVAVE